MVGRHARERGSTGSRLAKAWFGLREVLVLVVVGGALPAALLLLTPRLENRVDDLDPIVFALAAIWPLLLTVILWVLGHRRPARLVSPTIALVGTALACGAAYLGWIDNGYTGMARNGLVVLGTSLIAAGVTLAAQRIAERRCGPAPVTATDTAWVPPQRLDPGSTLVPAQRDAAPTGSEVRGPGVSEPRVSVERGE